MTITASDGSWFRMDAAEIKERDKMHRCLKCPYSTKYKSNLKAHNYRVHEKQKPVKNDSPQHCSKFCGYSTLNPFNLRRHEKTCTWSGPGVFSIEDIITIVCTTRCSFQDTAKIMKIVRARFGRCSVEPNLLRKIAKMVADLKVWFSTEYVVPKDRYGQDVTTCVSYVKFLKEFRDWVARGRGISQPKFTYSMDGGQGKFIIVINCHDDDEAAGAGDRNNNGHKATGCRLTLPVLQVDLGRKIPENRHNVEKLCGLVTFPEEEDFEMVTDLKGTNITTGLGGCTGTNFCSFGKCYKVDSVTGKKTNKRGLVVKGDDRWMSFQVEQNQLFKTVGKSNKKIMNKYVI